MTDPKFDLAGEVPGLRRRELIVRGGAGALALAGAGSLLAACGGGSSSVASSTTTSGAPQASGTIDFIGFEGDDGAKLPAMKQWTKANDVTVKSTYTQGVEEPLQKLKSGAASGIDLNAVPSSVVPRYAELGEPLQPIDVAQIPNVEHLAPTFSEASDQTHEGGNWIAIPYYASAFAPIWNAEVVPEVNNWGDLAKPDFANGLVIFPEPNIVANIGQEVLGLGEQGEISKSDLPKLISWVEGFIGNARSFASSFGDAISQMSSGEAKGMFPGFTAIAIYAQEAGAKTVLANNYPADGNVWGFNTFAIPNGADNVEAAYAYINQMLEPKVQAEIAGSVGGLPTIPSAERFLSPTTKKLFPGGIDKLATLPKARALPLQSDEFVTQEEWTEQFNSLIS